MSRPSISYQPALDGTRGLSVLAVVAFHLGASWMTGGYLGVSVFFTLSGYLITSLLVAEHESSGRIAFGAFYARRARRLLPASLVCLAGVVVIALAGGFDGVPGLRRDVWGALGQVFNWVKLFSGESYADINAAKDGLVNPLDHYWSLAIEEQFYWVWPLAFVGLMALARRTRRRPITILAVITAAAAVAAPLIAQTWGPDAAYWSTPARISEILIGALVAVQLAGRPSTLKLPIVRWLAPIAGVALVVSCVLFPDGSGPAYEGALPLVALASAALIVGLQVDGPVRRALSWGPLVAVGKVSYGIYLFHWPVFALVDRRRWDLPDPVLVAIKLAITAAVTVASYLLIEQPIRKATHMPKPAVLMRALSATAVVALAAVFVTTTNAAYYGVDQQAAAQASIDTGPVDSLVAATTSAPPLATATSEPAEVSTTMPATTTSVFGAVLPDAAPSRPVRIVVIGDSTAEATGAGLVAWAAANPAFAQVEVFAKPGCGLSLGGVLVFSDNERAPEPLCADYLTEEIPERVAALAPDVVMLMTTTWDVADRRVAPGAPVLASNSPEIATLIQGSFQTLTDTLRGLGVPRVVWIKQTPTVPGALGPHDKQSESARHTALHQVMDAIAANDPEHVRTVDLAGFCDGVDLLADSSARPDAVHWTADASLRIATEFLGPALVREALT